MITCDRLSKVYRSQRGAVMSLDALSLTIQRGEFLVVRGPSGCGKTTLLLILGGMLRPSAGSVLFEGRDLYAMTGQARAQFRAQNVGFVFQMFHLVPFLTVLENVLLAAQGVASPTTRQRAMDLLSQFRLADRAHHIPAELSTGERQRTALARALLNQPKLILADEPTGNLDPDNAAEVFRHLGDYHRAGGTVVVVTHGSAGDAGASRAIELRSGRIVAADASIVA